MSRKKRNSRREKKLSFAENNLTRVSKKDLTARRLSPQSLANDRRDGLSDSMLSVSPGLYNLDVIPTRSSSTAHGYMILSNQQYFDLLDEIYETDEVLRMCLDLIVAYMMMRPQGVRVEGEDADKPESEAMINFFNEKIVDNPECNFKYMMWSLALGILIHGRSTIEIVWKQDADGSFVPAQFYHCHPGQFVFDRVGRMRYADEKQAEVESLKFISAANHALYDNPFGRSELFPFRYKWQYKKRVLVAKLQYLQRYGTPIVHGTVPNDVVEKEEVMGEFVTAIENLEYGMAIVTAQGEGIQVHQRATSGLGGSDGAHDAILDRFDSYFVKSILGAELTTKDAKNGTQALGSVQERTVLNKILPFAGIVCNALNLGLFDPCRKMNFGVSAPLARYWMDTEESTDAKDARDTLACAVENGVEVTVRQAQEMLGIEPRVSDEPVLDKPSSSPTVIDRVLSRNSPTDKESESIDLPVEEDELSESEKKLIEDTLNGMTNRAFEARDKRIALENDLSIKDGDDPFTVQRKIRLRAEESMSQFFNESKLRNVEINGVPFDGVIPTVTRETKFQEHSFGCAMLELSQSARLIVADYLANVIDEDDLYIHDDGSSGAVLDTHCTVLYGLHDTVTAADVESAVAGEFWQWLSVGGFEVFEQDDHDVLVMKVHKDDSLLSLRESLLTLPHTLSRPEFRPHVTIAYLKKGAAAKYAGEDAIAPLEGWIEPIEWLTFSDSNKRVMKIALTGDLVEMEKDSLRDAIRFSDRVKLSAPVNVKNLWTRLDEAGNKFRAVRMAVNREAEKLGRTWEQAVTAAVIEDTKEQLIHVLKDTAERLKKYGDQPVSSAMTRDVDLSRLDLVPSFKRVVLSMFMVRQFISYNELQDVKAQEKKFDSSSFAEEDVLDLLPEGFRDAAEWMAARGVMTIARIREIARIMSEQTGGDVENYERDLRDHYLALAHATETSAAKKIQGLLEKSVKKGETLQDFLSGIEALTSEGDLPPGLESYWETVFRTEVGNAYKHAQTANEMDLDFEPYHWGWEGYNPNDDRSDPTHAAIDGKKFKKGSSASQSLGLPPWRFNCRCSLFALTTPDADNPTYKESSSALFIASRVTRF